MPEGSEQARGTGHGKVILLGEHAVVYGVPALVASIHAGATATARWSTRDRIVLLGQELAEDHDLYSALGETRRVLSAPTVSIDFEVDIPLGVGLGASAALGVASARALVTLLRRQADRELETNAADAWERVLHGTPSGVDRAAAQLGGVLHFVRGQTPEAVLPRRALPLVCAIAGPPASTREMVASVARLQRANPAQFERNLDAIRSLSENAVRCVSAGDLKSLGQLMNLCQMVLSGWMLSTEGIEIACATARQAGALGAKLTGSGGGGAIVALAEDEDHGLEVTQALEKAGFRAFHWLAGQHSLGQDSSISHHPHEQASHEGHGHEGHDHD